ncbi:ShlB/FhaC/HecB family hemolysin secretion/activation protein [Candidatus Parabeggiatoa sp. HSG14]|uniref:ShlB/FhaC/HecB family hemolysin secretion/activation protein n=1 Tax=Candidatus Parabeggiatoa sp. HSG14 TaxID=3055593 RepID=UPI0025A78914|nr:ShlB/FhaC/HecB family hemolysin secretion/activation protein [Thiotrichales bacterium HSG14]
MSTLVIENISPALYSKLEYETGRHHRSTSLFAICFISICVFINLFSQNAHTEELDSSSTTDVPLFGKVFVRQFQLVGNTVFSTAELRTLIRDYEGNEITAEELHKVKNNLTQYYKDHGYLNAGAIILDQAVKNGIITLEIVEGHLLAKDAIGSQQLRDYAITRRMQILPQNPWCEPIAAKLRPTFVRTEGQIGVEETRPYLINFNFNNHRSPERGANRGEISFIHHNLVGVNDVFNLCYGHTKGIDDYSLDYAIPIFSRDTMLSIGLGKGESSVEESPFNLLDVESETKNLSLSLRHLLYKTDQQYLMFFSRLQKVTNKTFLLDRPFSFSPGVRDGKSNITLLSVGSEWFYQSRQRVIRPFVSLNFGLDAFDSTINEDGSPDSEFFILFGAFNWTEYLQTLDSQLSFYTTIQYANHDLLPSAKSTLGGIETVRGYRENLFSRDRTFHASLEWQVPVTQWRIPGLSKVPEDGIIHLIPFVDYGWGENADSNISSEPNHISSIGLGLRWFPSETIGAEVFWGKALRSVNDPDEHDLQDEGIHFELSFQIY